MRVAVVGQGPKGIYALSELLQHWSTHEPLEIHTFDPHPVGHGSAFAVDQPDHQRLNIRPATLELPPLPPFVDWLAAQGHGPAAEDLPRSIVGRYLVEAHAAMLRDLPRGTTLVHHACGVRSVTRVEASWLVSGDSPVIVDEVLLSTGHAPHHDEELSRTWDHDQPTRLISSIYPVTIRLDEQQVPPGSVVAVRGAALTFIDAALALIEGREPDARPSRILPISRSGTLMHARPAPGNELPPQDRALLETFRQTLPADHVGIIDTVRTAATALLVNSGHRADQADAMVETTMSTGWEPDLLDAPQRALAALHRSVAVAEFAERPGAAWMLGRTWATLYPTVVRLLSFTDPDGPAWEEYTRRTAILDRFAFGPGLGNARRIADLCERRVVDLSWLDRGVRVESRIENLPDGESQPDVLIDAVPIPPGVVGAQAPVLNALLREGHVSIASGRRGIRVTTSAQCIGTDGTPTPGLSALGRATEDVVMGNDSLNQALHDQVSRWAERLGAATSRERSPDVV